MSPAAGSVSAGFTPVAPVPAAGVSPGVLAGAAGLVRPGLVSAGSVRLGVVEPLGLVRPGLVSAGFVSDDDGEVNPPGVVRPPGEVRAGLAPPRLPSPPPPKPGMLRPESPGIWTPNCEVICWTAPMTSPGRSDTIAACTNSCWEGAGAAAWVMLVARAMANGLATASAATELKAVESRRRRRLGTEVSSISGRSLMVFCGFACAITGFPAGVGSADRHRNRRIRW
ncbi:Uncharacterised protein [Mycobacteroides abscessus subsp. abscessus]|nr:Uncharacterised protein [Mycobacteroides abscessus subsp. abscessus]